MEGLLPPPPLSPPPPSPPLPAASAALPPLSDDDHAPSCLLALQEAWARMTAVLFKPFDIALWLGIGLCAWFASVGRFDWTGLLDLKELAGNLQTGLASHGWEETAAALSGAFKKRLVAVATFSAVAVTAVFSLVMMWVRARGALLSSTAGTVRAPPSPRLAALRQSGNSLFAMRLALTCGFVALLSRGRGGARCASPTARRGRRRWRRRGCCGRPACCWRRRPGGW